MPFDEVIQAIQMFGFPVVCAIALALFCAFIIKRDTERSDKREEKLYTKIDECQQINKVAIETIASYADKLDKIENNVSDIKEDILVIKTKFDQ